MTAKQDFDAESVRKLVEESRFQFVTNLKWNRNEKNVTTLDRIETKVKTESGDYQLSITTSWLLDTQVEDEYLGDPRTASAVPLPELKFPE